MTAVSDFTRALERRGESAGISQESRGQSITCGNELRSQGHGSSKLAHAQLFSVLGILCIRVNKAWNHTFIDCIWHTVDITVGHDRNADYRRFSAFKINLYSLLQRHQLWCGFPDARRHLMS